MSWLNNSAHMVFLLVFFICIIVGQGIVIFRLTRDKKNIDYGKSELAKKVAKFQEFWGSFVVYVLSTSIIGIFIAKLVLMQNITLEDMNSWVSIILGLVALIVGIISLYLSFYNLEQASRSQEKNLEDMSILRDVVEDKIKEMHTLPEGWGLKNGHWVYYEKGTLAKNSWKKVGMICFIWAPKGTSLKIC